MKKCPRCKETKSDSKFYISKVGLSSYCKKCVYDRKKAFCQTPQGKINRHKYRQTHAERESRRMYRINNPEKIKGQGAVQRAIQSGKLNAASSYKCYCGERAQHYHHLDYSKPLKVIPVCAKCHAKEHV